MKISILIFAFFMALCGAMPAEPKRRPFCNVNRGYWAHDWGITFPDVDDNVDKGQVCHQLWKWLKPFIMCVVSNPKCGKARFDDLEWRFRTSILCSNGMVQKAFYDATKNKYGVLDMGGCD